LTIHLLTLRDNPKQTSLPDAIGHRSAPVCRVGFGSSIIIHNAQRPFDDCKPRHLKQNRKVALEYIIPEPEKSSV
jgi:hypothetical protein